MKTEVPIYSRLSELTRIFRPNKLVCSIIFILLSFAFTELKAQDATQTTVTINSTAFCSTTGINLTATVSDIPNPGNIPTGTVQLRIDGLLVGANVTLVNGVATLTTPLLSA